MLGTQVGPYSIVRELGAGAMGAVYEAHHAQLGRRVALKVLKRESAGSPEMLTRFFNEARAVNGLSQPLPSYLRLTCGLMNGLRRNGAGPSLRESDSDVSPTPNHLSSR